MDKAFYVTTPIYYVNAQPHIGHAYTSIAADVTARFHRLDDKTVFFLTGTDEHGQKVEKAANDAGVDPQTYVDRIAVDFRAMAQTLGVSFDRFIRTTDAEHVAACQALWTRLALSGHIYLGAYSGWYSIKDETFYDETEIVSQPGGEKTAPTGAPVEWVSEPSYFFRLSAWQQPLLDFYESRPDFIAPVSRRNEVIAFVRSGLKDLSVSRTKVTWGVPVPGEPEHVMYVWFDALINYLSGLGWPDVSPGSPFSEFWPADLHLVGKEIARFHAVYWPALLMAADIALPRRVFSHGWWTVDGEKMSKSAGNGIDPRALVDEFGVDPLRFFLLREVPFGSDGDFNRRSLVSRLNNELANDLGNLAQRSLSLVARNCGGRLPEVGERLQEDRELLAAGHGLVPNARLLIERQALSECLEEIWRVVRAANAYIDRQAPWRLMKTDQDRMQCVLRVLVDVLHAVAIVLQPFMPDSMGRLLDQLGVPQGARSFAGLSDQRWGETVLPAPTGIFPRFVVDAVS